MNKTHTFSDSESDEKKMTPDDEKNNSSGSDDTNIANKLAEVKEIKRKLRNTKTTKKRTEKAGTRKQTTASNKSIGKKRITKTNNAKYADKKKDDEKKDAKKLSESELKKIFDVAVCLKKKWIAENTHYNNMLQLCTGDTKKDKNIVASLEKQKEKCNMLADEYEKLRNLL